MKKPKVKILNVEVTEESSDRTNFTIQVDWKYKYKLRKDTLFFKEYSSYAYDEHEQFKAKVLYTALTVDCHINASTYPKHLMKALWEYGPINTTSGRNLYVIWSDQLFLHEYFKVPMYLTNFGASVVTGIEYITYAFISSKDKMYPNYDYSKQIFSIENPLDKTASVP